MPVKGIRAAAATGAHLPLHEQLIYTDGYCEAFAAALLQRYPGKLTACELVVSDARYAKKLDYPADARIPAHVFCTEAERWVIDGEGRRPVLEMMRSFGVPKGYRHEILAKTPGLTRQTGPWDAIAHALDLMEAQGWPDDPAAIPRADDRLARNFRQAREDQQAAMAERNALPAGGEAALEF